jgi:hypothetical protein
MQIGRGGIKAGFDAQGTAGGAGLFQARAQVVQPDNLSRAFLEIFQLLLNWSKIGDWSKIGAHIGIGHVDP